MNLGTLAYFYDNDVSHFVDLFNKSKEWVKRLNRWVIRCEDLKRYKFLSALGSGGQAKVYKVMKHKLAKTPIPERTYYPSVYAEQTPEDAPNSTLGKNRKDSAEGSRNAFKYGQSGIQQNLMSMDGPKLTTISPMGLGNLKQMTVQINKKPSNTTSPSLEKQIFAIKCINKNSLIGQRSIF